MKKSFHWVMFILLSGLTTAIPARAAEKAQAIDTSKPRLVMVEVPSWKTTFFGLPRDLPLLINPGEKFAGQRQYDFNDGMTAMEIFIDLRPKDPKAKAFGLFLQKWPLYQTFFKCIDQEDYDQAADLLGKIKAIDPQEPAVYFYWGSLQTHLGKYPEAEKNYQICLRYFPDYGPAYINLARLVKARGADQEARKYLEEAVRRLEKSGQDDALTIARKMLESLKGK